MMASGSSGYSLIELVLVLSIVTLLIMVVMPNIHAISDVELRNEIMHLKKKFVLASEFAKLRGVRVKWVAQRGEHGFYKLKGSDWSEWEDGVQSIEGFSKGVKVEACAMDDVVGGVDGRVTCVIYFAPDGMGSVGDVWFSKGDEKLGIHVDQSVGGIYLIENG